jgi:DNA helicase IV
VADGALLDELVNLLGPIPVEEDQEVSLFLDPDSEISEVVTTADRLTRVREVDPFELPHQTYAHILVDEAQDTTPMQWRILRRRGASASWTIVGDPAQSSWPDTAEATRAVNEMVGTAPVRRFRMSTNYRSPAEVFDFAAQVVIQAYPEADLPRAVRSTGIEPLLLETEPAALGATVVETVRELLTQVEGTVGVIGPPARKAELVAELDQAGLADADRIAVVTSLESKGLEYDAVLVVTPDEIVATSPGGVRSLYVALTRPTQRLVTLDATPSAAWRRSLG